MVHRGAGQADRGNRETVDDIDARGQPVTEPLKAIEEAKLMYYHERLRDLHESDKNGKELRNLGVPQRA